MIDPGRLFSEAIYFLQYAVAQLMWAINRAALSIAIITEGINSWFTENVSYLIQLLVNSLAAPLGGMFILALTALGLWYLLNQIVPTSRWVDPSKLLLYGLIAFTFFSSPVLVIEMMEELRNALNAGIDQAVLTGAEGDIFAGGMDGTDAGLSGALGDVNSDGVIGSFDLVAAFMLVQNIDELDSSEFPVEFEAVYFPFGEPASIDLSDEADQELAKALANDGLERLFFSFVAIPTAIAEHFLRLALTGVALFLYTGAPIAMVFAFFVYTQAFIGAYLRQFLNLLIETLMSVIITAIMLSLLLAAAVEGVGLYIGASFLVFIVLLWRIKSALRLAAAAIDLFGGSLMTGGAGGMALVQTGQQVLGHTLGAVGTAATGGAALAAGGALLATAATLRADQQANSIYLGTDSAKTESRIRQLKTVAGYALGQSETVRHAIEGSHELRTFTRNFWEGQTQPHEPDTLDFFRAGAVMSGYGSSPWMAMRTSPSLRAAFDQIGGVGRVSREASFMNDAASVEVPEEVTGDGSYNRHWLPATIGSEYSQQRVRTTAWRQEPATSNQIALLQSWQIEMPVEMSRGQAHDLITLRTQSRSGSRPSSRIPERFADQPESWYGTTQQQTDEPHPLLDTNGPIPAWLQQPLETVELDSFPPAVDGPHLAPIGEPAPSFHLEPFTEARQQAVQQLVARLADPMPAGRTARQALVFHVGQVNADRLQTAVQHHGVEAVQQAITAAGDLVAHYRANQLDDAAIFTEFQQGRAAESIREQTNTPLLADQLAAVADMLLLPQRRVTRQELAGLIGRSVADGAVNEQPILAELNTPVHFGGQTGLIRELVNETRQLALSPEVLASLVALIEQGLRPQAQQALVGRGVAATDVELLLANLAALPQTLIMPQTVMAQPQSPDGDVPTNLPQGETE
ncbi:MAG: hypothetical protein H6657_00050 [Ardenticatenaceae bacterium]|nr:hypothetical protein [Ardenticatenaceae bacterium]